MKTIKLTQGKVALIDDKDYSTVSPYKWYALKIGKRYYAGRRYGNTTQYMHRLLLPEATEIDHKNRNGLDNRRCNIVSCDRTTNLSNRDAWGYSKTKGVSYHRGNKLWYAYLGSGTKRKWLGYFNTELEATQEVARLV